MLSAMPTAPIEKRIVLVGAGNAHLQFIKRWRMRPLPGVAVTLVSPDGVIPYSAMIPGHIAGEFSWDEASIDLVRLCSSAGVRFLRERVTAINPQARQVQLTDRPALGYDALSLGLGSIPAIAGEPTPDGPASLVMRPLGPLVQRLDMLAADLHGSSQGFHLAVVGGGASGCELALAIHKRFAHVPSFRLTLFQGADRLLPHFPGRAGRLMLLTMRLCGITVHLGARVTGTAPGCLTLETGEQVSCDAVLWATNATPPPILRRSGLAVDEGGFLRVRLTLQSETDPAIFGTGDCVAFAAYPDLPRNGVHAVRQGGVLFDNLAAFLHERQLQPFRPQWLTLALLNTSDGAALLCYGPLVLKSGWARRWKTRIDRRWVAMFTPAPLPHRPAAEEFTMRCGGCGSKISGDVLGAVLSRLDVPGHERVILGTRAGEDAAVFRIDATPTVEVQTVDYFKAFVDDPYLFGRVAALHAVSDLYAMNARPFAALAVATLPHARGPVQEEQLHELLAGATREFRDLGIALAGGHTAEGQELAVGFAMTGLADEPTLFRKSGLQPGDVLILTKPLGSGALLAAWMRGQCRSSWFEPLLRGLLIPNKRAADIFAATGVKGCTDITGFGLAGHLLEMLDASQVSAELDPSAIPLYDGFFEVVGQGIVSTLQRDNAKVGSRIVVDGPLPEWLFDPQTSGGLLAAVAPDQAAEVLRRLHDAGLPHARTIGQVVALVPGDPPAIRLTTAALTTTSV
jgi:selenide,water dikinase